MTADWRDFTEADFRAELAPRGYARKRAAEQAGALFDVHAPVSRPAKTAAPAEQLPGQADLFGEDGQS